jgi:hypothetical protein
MTFPIHPHVLRHVANDERPVALPPVWLEERSMSKTDQYR